MKAKLMTANQRTTQLTCARNILLSALIAYSPISLAGGDTGGGGGTTDRTPVSATELYSTIETIHKVARYNFKYIFGSNGGMSGALKPFAKVINKIENKVNTDPDFFRKVKLEIQEITQTTFCDDGNGNESSASYHNGIICFDIKKIIPLKYNGAEAETKLMALYAHEIAHAAGYTNSVADETLLKKFQDAVEEELVSVSFSLENYKMRLQNPLDLGQPPLTLRMRLKQMESNADKGNKSLAWHCSKLQSAISVADNIPVYNRQMSEGLSLLTAEEESQVDLLIWEMAIFAAINCDGQQDELENINELLSSPQPTMFLQDALIKIRGVDFCDPYYSPRVCKTAQLQTVFTKPVSMENIRQYSAVLAWKMLEFFKRFDEISN